MQLQKSSGGAGTCPVKDLALTVQQFIDAANAADRQLGALPAEAEKKIEQRVEANQLRARRGALTEWITSKHSHALTMQALSPGGALHQLAVLKVHIDEIWDLVPSEREDEGQPSYDMLRWGIYSVANVLEQLSVTPRELLAVEYYLPANASPFARSAFAKPADQPDRAEQRLAVLNQWMEEVRALRNAGWERADQTDGDENAKAQGIVDRCERDISAIMVEAATIPPCSLRGFALKARLLTCVHGSEETNFTDEEDALYRALIGQLLGAADLGRIDDGSEGTREFAPIAAAFLSAEAA